MEESLNTPICRHAFKAQTLVDSYPPKLKNKNKKIAYQIACPPSCTHSGEIVFARWRAMPLPEIFINSDDRTKLEERTGYFGYEPSNQNSTQVEWYLNFAHSDLFCAYGGPLFAQDEMQVVEHPALGSLREELLDAKIEPLTVESSQPTPVTIYGVERRCAISTDINADLGRPFGLYGNNFARATPEAIQLATTALDPPTISNIVAIEAPPGGYGSYTDREIEYILVTAFTGFSAAQIESSSHSTSAAAIVQTGFWGCGAYGGNRILMALLQLLAARMAGIDRLVFHTGEAKGSKNLATAREILDRDLAPIGSAIELSALMRAIQAMEFQWGVSDGN
ncbi:MAG: hypothetical protein KME17_15605 [Cyanosarcina radialis HA8281-LM2]|jgi:hypothetical protein|nr:hypothetical protein [Cyanosarcina radialis HA8281-LM2]